MSNTVRKHRLKANEQKLVLSYVKQKTLMNRLSKELDKMKQNVVDLFEKAKQNVIIVQDENGENFGLQKINRKRQKFETNGFKLHHNDLYYKYCTTIQYDEYKVIGGTND
jgi:peptidyl-tRNA hydrolase